jgi:predicted CoA-substrate-specific enzyme activase
VTWTLGLDVGSTYCKGALIGPNGLVKVIREPTGWDLAGVATFVATSLKSEGQEALIAATGFGRGAVLEAQIRPTEITCHARGAEYLYPGARTIIDLGGQDAKIIIVESGKVKAFQMNDKCAAGTGRFLELALNRLAISLDSLPADWEPPSISLNSPCAVFAETEILGLLAQGISRLEILKAVAMSLANRAASLAGRLNPHPPLVLTGGLAGSPGLALALSRSFGLPALTLANGAYAGAIGAALLLRENT